MTQIGEIVEDCSVNCSAICCSFASLFACVEQKGPGNNSRELSLMNMGDENPVFHLVPELTNVPGDEFCFFGRI